MIKNKDDILSTMCNRMCFVMVYMVFGHQNEKMVYGLGIDMLTFQNNTNECITFILPTYWLIFIATGNTSVYD